MAGIVWGVGGGVGGVGGLDVSRRDLWGPRVE